MADRTIEYKVIIDTSTGKSSITDLNGNLVEAENLIKKLGETTKQSTEESLAKIRDLGLAYNSVKDAISTIANTFKEFINEAESARKAGSQLDLALKNINAEYISQSIKDMANSLQEAGIQEADAAIQAAAMGIQMGISADKIEEATTGAIGLSKTYNTDLNSAMKLIAGGMQGNYDMLGRLNPAMRAAGTEAEKAAIFQKMLADGFKFAESEGKTFSGQMEKLQNNIGDIKEAIGGFLINAILPLVKSLSENMPLAIGVVSGALVGMIVPVYTLITAVSALGTAVTAATGGLNLLIAAGAALTVGGIAYAATMDDEIKATQELTESTKTLSETELNAAMDKAAAVDFAMMRTIDYMKLKDKELEQASIAAGLAGFSNKEAAERYSIHHQALLQAEETLKKNTAAWNAFYDQRKILADVKIAEMTEDEKAAAAKKLEEQKKLDDELFQERMAADNAETERLKAEQDKRIADNQAFLIKQQEETDRINDEMEMREIEGAWKVAEETKKAAKEKSDAEKKAQQDKAEYQKRGLKDSLNNLQALKTLGKDAANIAKGAAVASATIDTIESAGKSYKWGASWGGPVGGAIMAAIAVAAGAARVAQITATGTGFQSGGYTGDLPENQAAGTVHGREFVMNAETTRRVGVQTLSAIQAGVPVTTLPSAQFAGNATTSGLNSVSGSVQAMNMNMVNGTMPAPVIEINANTDLVNFEIKRREVSNEVDKTGRSFDNVS